MRLPIVKRFSVENFLSPKTRTFGSVFRTPWKNPWTDLSETYGHVFPCQALRLAIYGAKQRLAVFTEIRLIKKRRKTCAEYNSLPYRHTPERVGGCKEGKRFIYLHLQCSNNLSLKSIRTSARKVHRRLLQQ